MADTISRSKLYAEMEVLFDRYMEKGSTDHTEGSPFIASLVELLQSESKPRNWIREAVSLKNTWLESKKSKHARGQKSLFGLDCIYSLGKVKDEKGVEKYRSARGSEMTIAQLLLYRAVVVKNRDDVVVDADEEIALIDAIQAESRRSSEKAATAAKRLGLTVPVAASTAKQAKDAPVTQSVAAD